MSNYQAWRVHENDGQYTGAVETLDTADLPQGDVLIRVTHSSLNYKDALSASGNKGVTRNFPHTPGIDAAGEVIESESGQFSVGQQVLVTGFDLGMGTAGGFGEYIRVPAEWVVVMPKGWSARTAMVYGTAGLTAGLCVSKLLRMGASPDKGPVLVTGATGAVGTVAVELLSTLGFEVTAMTGKADMADQLKALGAANVAGRELLEPQKKPMLKPQFAAAVDTVGGEPLAEVLKQLLPGGSVACCGLVAGMDVPTSVYPFILRGVNLLGVDSVEIPLAEKEAIWSRLSGDWACSKTEKNAREIGKGDLGDALAAFLKGESSGSVVLAHGI
ncbi:acrylyl-CoA reductase family protein [Marinobacter sp. 1Y8]